jgi:accessory gene regulator B
MMRNLSLQIARAIKSVDEENTASIEVMKFSIEALLNTLVTVIVVFIVGWLTGTLGETIIALVATGLLRFISGGYHLKNAVFCTIVSTIVISISPYIHWDHNWRLILLLPSCILLAIFAPSGIEGHARIDKKYFPLLKIGSVLMVCSNLYFDSATLATVFFIQALSTIQLVRR